MRTLRRRAPRPVEKKNACAHSAPGRMALYGSLPNPCSLRLRPPAECEEDWVLVDTAPPQLAEVRRASGWKNGRTGLLPSRSAEPARLLRWLSIPARVGRSAAERPGVEAQSLQVCTPVFPPHHRHAAAGYQRTPMSIAAGRRLAGFAGTEFRTLPFCAHLAEPIVRQALFFWTVPSPFSLGKTKENGGCKADLLRSPPLRRRSWAAAARPEWS